MLLLLLISISFQDGLRGIKVQRDDSPRYIAYLIGVQDYKDKNIPDLLTPQADVERLAEVLERRFHFEIRSILLNEKATEAGIRDLLKQMVKDARSDDNILIYYAGHGVDGVGQTGYWMPYDSRPKAEETYLSNADLISAMENCKAKHVLAISDSCYSGSLFIDRVLNEKHQENLPKYAMGAGGEGHLDYRAKYSRKSRAAMTSGNLEPVADSGPNKEHSVFAYYLLETLENTSQPFLTPTQITGEIGSLVSLNTEHKQLPRSDRLRGDKGGTFIFWNREAVAPDGSPFVAPWQNFEDAGLIDLKANLRNRKVWVTGSHDQSLCDALRDLGLNVDCEAGWVRRTNARQEIVAFCGQIRSETVSALRSYLGLNTFRIMTHNNRPDLFVDDECGRSYEITIRN